MNAIIKLFGTALILLFVTTAKAQFSFGAKGGYTFQNISTSNPLIDVLPNFKTNRTFTLGAVGEYALTNQFAVQGEINFVRKGFVVQEGFDLNLGDFPVPLGVKATTNIKYIDVPLLAKYKFGTGAIGGYVIAGPTFGYARSGNFKTSANVLVDINLTNTALDFDALNVSRWEVGGAIGAGATANLTGGSQLFVDARFTQGFTKLDNLPVIDADFKNRGLALTAGFLIPINKNKGGMYASR